MSYFFKRALSLYRDRSTKKYFDASFYLLRYDDVRTSGYDAWGHYMRFGMAEGRQPRADFDPTYYAEKYRKEIGGEQPFRHWATVGRAKGWKGHPWIVDPGVDDLELMRAEFDPHFYGRSNPDVAKSSINFFQHFLQYGWKERRNPASWFNINDYIEMNPELRETGLNPFSHYVVIGRSQGLLPAQRAPEKCSPTMPVASSANTFSEHLAFSSPGPDYEAIDDTTSKNSEINAKLIAYYLPQFHPIPENDEWWGPGFTEWRNVVRGQPRYRGHQQPRIPEMLGFYGLTDVSVVRKQVELAKLAGIYCFCFYYYNFNGRRILEKPIENFINDRGIDFPFCLMWANENWTRTWDGQDGSILLKQNYRREDDVAILCDIARHFVDSRYIRIGGRPLFFIYRPSQIPGAIMRFKRWRSYWEEFHGINPLIFMVQSFDDLDPRLYGLDGAIEFPPHKICKDMQPLNASLELFDPEFTGHVVSYNEAIENSIREAMPPFPLIKTAVPSWDNEARRPGRGMSLKGAKPAHYERWLRKLVDIARENPVYGERFVAVNAWNEWAEGAYLEPDVYHGAAYLNATARALTGAS